MDANEARGVGTAFPHPSVLYRKLVSKLWTVELCTVLVFGLNFALDDAICPHACSSEALYKRVTNGTHLKIFPFTT